MPALPPELLRSRVTGDHREATWRLSIIQPLRHETAPRTPERAAAIAELASRAVIDWRNRTRQLAERTLREWIARYEASGVEGLMRKAPKNAGKRRVYFSRPLDRVLAAVGRSEAEIAEFASTVRKQVRGEWVSGTPSWPTVQLNTLPYVVELARKAGIDQPDLAMHRLCQVPRRFIEAERRYAIVAMMRKDAAKFAATVTPRIKRDRSHLRPLDWLAADVHHCDILFRTADGRVVTPKAVAWLDLATNRTRIDFFIVPKGEMIRREHVVQSFVDLCSDRDWGVPTHLYTDNGGEYDFVELIDDLAKLKIKLDLHIGEDPTASKVGAQRARPYNPQGKVIEGLFSTVERVAFAQLPGWIGGERMRKKTANQGREPNPFPGDEARLREALATALAYHHAKPQTGHLNGLSPNDSFRAFVEKGWTATVLDRWQLAVAFSKEFPKLVRAGGTFRLEKTDYRADELQSFVGRKVIVRQPLFGDRDTLFVFSEDGEALAIAQPDTVFAFGDPAGAAEQGRRSGRAVRDVRALEAQAATNAGGEVTMAKVVKLFGSAANAEPADAIIRLNPEFCEAADMARNAPERQRDAISLKQAKRAEKSQFLERMVAGLG